MIIEPTTKQMEFLRASEDIVLFGGSVGGGKSWAILIDACGLNDKTPRISLSYYRSLIVRRQYNHLTDLIDKSKQLYPYIDSGAVFNHSELVWKFSSGAQIRFDYFENIQQCEGKLIGKEFASIYIDEIQLYENIDVMRFCLSRLRSSQGLKCYFRATCNPSRHRWLRQFFKIPDNGSSTNFIVEQSLPTGEVYKQSVRYIQSKLTDNPYLGPEYMEKLMMLSDSDRNALINGVWNAYDITDAMVYRNEYKKLTDDNRITTVPYQLGHDVYAAFDLGFGDNTSIVLFQIIGKEYHILESFENNNKVIDWYVQEIKNRGYTTQLKIILPHDAKKHSLESGLSVEEIMNGHFTERNVKVLPRIANIENGIDAVRKKFPYFYIDKSKNEKLIDAIINYEREYNPKIDLYGAPIHNRFSHMADALRYVCEYTQETTYDFSDLDSSPQTYTF